jgi:hypothetical protein
MEPGVPFALLGAVVLLAAAGWTALAGSVAVQRGSRTGTVLVAAGALVLLVLEARTATQLGRSGTDDLAVARSAGLLLVGAGLYTGALLRRRRHLPALEPGAAAGVVVPLQVATGPAVLGLVAGVLAAAGAVRGRRDLGGGLVAAGLLASGGAVAAGTRADTASGAQLALGLRGLGALLVLAGLVVLARSSLLAKVVAAILAGVLATAVVAVGVIGTTVVRGYDREQAALVADAARGREQLLSQALERLRVLTPIFAEACTGEGRDPAVCDGVVRQFTEPEAQNFALLVPREGEPRPLGGRAALSPAEALGLAGSPLVARALEGGPAAVRGTEVGGSVPLLGPEPGLAQVVVQPLQRATPTDPAAAAFVYGVRVGQGTVASDFDVGGFGYSILVGDEIVASNLSDRGQQVVEQAARASGTLPADGTTVLAEGDRPTVHLRRWAPTPAPRACWRSRATPTRRWPRSARRSPRCCSPRWRPRRWWVRSPCCSAGARSSRSAG